MEKEDSHNLSIAILNGDYDTCKEILEKGNINVNQYYVFYGDNKKSNAFEDCYRNMQRIQIAELITEHHTFDPNEKSVTLGSEPHLIDILEFFVKIYESKYPVEKPGSNEIMMELSGGELIYCRLLYKDQDLEEEFAQVKPFIDLVISHPKILESTIQNSINKSHMSIMKSYLSQYIEENCVGKIKIEI